MTIQFQGISVVSNSSPKSTKAAFYCALCVLGVLSVFDYYRRHKSEVQYSEIESGRTKIMGRLGVPIGTFVEVKGHWIPSDDPDLKSREGLSLIHI